MFGRFKGLDSRDFSSNDIRHSNLAATISGLSWWGGISSLIIVAASIGNGLIIEPLAFDARTFLTVLASALLIAAGAWSVGGLLGFLFGIPRTHQQELSPVNTPKSADGNRDRDVDSGYRQVVNTNLEQISDWLTKILVGVGLTQLNELPSQLWKLGTHFSIADSVQFSIAVIINFVIFGFFTGYLLTRLFLARALYDAESSWLLQQTEKAKVLTEVGAYDKAAEAYEKALQGVTSQTPKEQKRSVYDHLVFNFLYENPPAGFERAIQYAKQYIAGEPDYPSARIWAYLAAAYGQQYKFLTEQGAPADELESIKSRAFEATKEALRNDSKIKGLLEMMWNPKSAIKSPEDDDLEVFYEMDEFKKLLS